MDHSEWDGVGNLCLNGNNCVLKPAWQAYMGIECINDGNRCEELTDTSNDQCLLNRESCKDNCCNFVSWQSGTGGTCIRSSSCIIGPSEESENIVYIKTIVTGNNIFLHMTNETKTIKKNSITRKKQQHKRQQLQLCRPH